MTKYVGLDVSMEETSICVHDDAGRRLAEGKVVTSPEAIADWLRAHAPEAVKIGMETGSLAPWLYHELTRLGVPIVCMDARQAHRVLSLKLNKTDRIDAGGLAEIVRVGWFKPVEMKSYASLAIRALITARTALVRMRVDLENQVRGTLKPFGLLVGRGRGPAFAKRVAERVEPHPELARLVAPLLAIWRQIGLEVAELTRRIVHTARDNEVCHRFMGVPGIGPITALGFLAEIDDPHRFRSSTSVGAYLGMTPRRYQSGETDWSGRISKRGDTLMRALLNEAATVLLTRTKGSCALKTWGLRLRKRLGFARARVAVARKLAVLLHAMWRSGQPFHWNANEDHRMSA